MNYKTRQPFPHAAYVEGQRNFTYFDRSLTSGLTDVVIESTGDFLYIDQASTGVVSVELNMRQGGTLAPILLAAGGSIECDFSSIKLNASAQLNKTARIIVGNGARIKGGATVAPTSETIQTVDGSRFRTDGETAIMGQAYCGPLAGNYSHAQVFNPSTSNKNVYINKLLISASAATFVNVDTNTTQLASSPSPSGNMMIKKFGAGAASTLLRIEKAAAAIASAYYGQIPVPANQPVDAQITEPLLLRPGYGLVIQNQLANQDLFINVQGFFE